MFAFSLVSLLVGFSSPAFAQFIFPPPLPSDQTLDSYASGKVATNASYAQGDSIYGSFAPSQQDLFVIYRCVQPPSSKSISAPNITITSSSGLSGGDGTWIYPWTFVTWAYTNAYSPGQNLLYFSNIPDPSTSGNLCWFELSTGKEGQETDPPFDRFVLLDMQDSRTRYISMPFTVLPQRANGEVTTWTTKGNASALTPGELPGFTLSLRPTSTQTIYASPASTATSAGNIVFVPTPTTAALTSLTGTGTAVSISASAGSATTTTSSNAKATSAAANVVKTGRLWGMIGLMMSLLFGL